jgi:hypothetical protein
MWFGRSRKTGSRSEVQPIQARERMMTPGEEYVVGRHREREFFCREATRWCMELLDCSVVEMTDDRTALTAEKKEDDP